MLGPQVNPRPTSTVDPRLIAANSIIQLTTVELEQAITRELDENPALELAERQECPICGGNLQFGSCVRCIGIHAPSESQKGTEDVESDPLWFVPAPLSLPERLIAQLRLTLIESEHELAMYVVGNLDEHGYFSSSVEELAQTLDVDAARIQTLLIELQKLDPAGIGARNTTECLLIQLERLTSQGMTAPLATKEIIQDHLDDLGHQHFERIRSALHISREQVEEAFLFIRTNLHPYPAYHYYEGASAPSLATPPCNPSILIHQSSITACGYEVEIMESHRFILRVNPLYQKVRLQPHLALSPAELEHVNHFLERARLFINHIQRRYQLLYKVATYLVNYQCDFLSYGSSYLRPLTQTAVAQEINVHVSTISRVVAGKYAQVPSKAIIPLATFFSAEQRVQDLIRLLITNEMEPLSDKSIAKLLNERHNVALSRQMVANYRMQLGIPAARQRAALLRSRRKSYQGEVQT